MKFIKENIGFSVTVGVFLAGFIGTLVMMILARGTVSDLKETAGDEEAYLEDLFFYEPTPTIENRDKADQNAYELREIFQAKKQKLEKGRPVRVETDDTRFLTAIKGQTADFRERCKEEQITIAKDEAFGFARYDKNPPVNDALRRFIPKIDKQRQILKYLVEELIDSFEKIEPSTDENVEVQTVPRGIISVKREFIERTKSMDDSDDESAEGSDLFMIDPIATSRSEGVIDAMAFELTFYGHTNVFRKYLGKLVEEKMPVVIRDISVSPKGENDELIEEVEEEVEEEKPDASAAFEALFGLGGGSKPKKEAPKVSKKKVITQKPVIEDATTIFTVTVEYIELVLDVDKLVESEDS